MACPARLDPQRWFWRERCGNKHHDAAKSNVVAVYVGWICSEVMTLTMCAVAHVVCVQVVRMLRTNYRLLITGTPLQVSSTRSGLKCVLKTISAVSSELAVHSRSACSWRSVADHVCGASITQLLQCHGYAVLCRCHSIVSCTGTPC
jgi:hypothetical protein